MPDLVLVQRTTQIEDIKIESTTSLSEGAGGARKLGSAARRRNIGAVCSSLKASARRVFPSFWIFDRRDHGGLLQITGEPGKAVQYDIGNLRTVSRMTQHRCRPRSSRRCASCCTRTELAARPSNVTRLCRSLDSLARNARPAVARQLDTSLERVLVKRPAEQEDIHG